MTSSNSGYPLSSWLILFVLALTWGSSFILMKQGLMVFNGFQLGALRLSIAFICMVGFAIPHSLKLEKRYVRPILIVGVLGNGFPAFLFAMAQTKLESSQAGILNGLTPFFAFIVGWLFFNLQPNWRSVTGIVLGFAGAAGLIISKTGLSLNLDFGYSLLIVVATLFYGISANTIRHRCTGLKPIQISSMALSFIGIPAMIILLSSGFIETMQTNPGAMRALGFVAVLAIVGTALAVILFNKLLQDTSALFGSSVTYLMPLVAVAWGIADGEKLLPIQGLYGLIILSGIYLVNYQPKKVH